MATAILSSVQEAAGRAVQSEVVPVEVYLHSSYRPDRDYLDGYLLERNAGELPHSRLQSFFVRYFAVFEELLQVEVLPEQRVQVSPTRYRVPDICLVPLSSPDALIVRVPPLLCVEILSREDRIVDLHEKLEDYRRMGVQHTWVIDPWRQEAFVVELSGDWTLVREEMRLPGADVRLPVQEMFRALVPKQPRLDPRS